ncbi:hypothetical protein BHQ20_24930 [Mycobacterium intermedium]|uniref:Uncharacterized protein n=1 Tax=Mycobacterium bourgelatii TaxID=1273442 RepID=A0A7I9YUC7_MYCBU|nr:hypothetical protein BHQ20_24930 [Mycobacterium intermedium]GFG92228.1 hypothetical protein MBOU_42700 [Mycobacterium bourgelatii]
MPTPGTRGGGITAMPAVAAIPVRGRGVKTITPISAVAHPVGLGTSGTRGPTGTAAFQTPRAGRTTLPATANGTGFTPRATRPTGGSGRITGTTLTPIARRPRVPAGTTGAAVAVGPGHTVRRCAASTPNPAGPADPAGTPVAADTTSATGDGGIRTVGTGPAGPADPASPAVPAGTAITTQQPR